MQELNYREAAAVYPSREEGQIREIEALKVTLLGFIAANGFAEQEDGYVYYSGADLYRL